MQQQSKTNLIPKISFLWLLLTMSMVLSLNAAPIKIMPLGDSITEGTASIPETPDQNRSTYQVNGNLIPAPDSISYRGELWDLLKAGNYEIDFVGSKNTGSSYPTTDFDTDHEGHGGFSTTNIKDNIVGYLDNNTPDIVLLHIGTNNMTLAAVDDVESILTTIFTKNANAKVFVARIIENERGTGLTRVTTTDFNDAVAAMVGTHVNTASIQMVNMQTGAGLVYDPAGLPNDMQPFHADDNISDYHPNAKGYAKMATKWYVALVASDWLNLTPSTPNASTGKNHLWKLDEVSGPFSDTTSSVDATCVTTSCPITATGKVGKALDFTGTGNRFLKTTVGSYNADDNYTIAFWMKPETNANRDVMVHIGDLWIGRTNTNLEIELKSGTSSIVGTLILNAWNHVVLVKEGTNAARTYVNGTLSNTQVNTGASKIAGETFIGTHTLGSFQYKGLLDEVSIYNTALTAAEVQTMYSVGADTNDTNDTNNTTDIIAPVITLKGTNPQQVALDGNYTELTATALDAVDGNLDTNITINSAAVDTSKVGSYQVSYTVSDNAGNTAETNRTVVVKAAVVVDTQVPVITLKGDATVALKVGDSYTDAGATAIDNIDGNITENIVVGGSTPDLNAAGIYKITYDVNDTAGNNAEQVTRIVTVTEVKTNTPPIITLKGDSYIQLIVGEAYIEQNATAIDAEDGNISADIVITGTVDTDTADTYIVTYNVKDKNGSEAAFVTRTVVVSPVVNTAPVITLIGEDKIKLNVGDTYTEQGAEVTDEQEENLEVTIGGDTVNTSKVGNYTITYNVNDSNGLAAAVVQRVVQVGEPNSTVVPNKAPVITLEGNQTVIAFLGKPYSDSGATATDAEDGNINVTTINTVNTGIVGSYTVNYTAIDSNGTKAAGVTRLVTVIKDESNPDANGNTIPDVDEEGKTWFVYDKSLQKATITDISTKKQSLLRALGVDVNASITGNVITLKDPVSNAYVSANGKAEVYSGFALSTGNDNTLKAGTFYKAGTSSTIKKDSNGISIQTRAKFNKNDTFVIGGL